MRGRSSPAIAGFVGPQTQAQWTNFDRPNPIRVTSPARELCREALLRLNADERELVELRQRGCDWDSIAREKNSTPVVLRKRLSRALDRVLHEVGLE